MGEAKRKAQVEAKHLSDCGDFVEALDKLIKARIATNIGPPIFGYTGEKEELLKREMKDFLRRNSVAKGIYVEGKC